MGESKLGFKAEDVGGLHSIQSGGAKTMFLSSGISTNIQQVLDRWSSEAFLEHIMEQVKNFTWGVSQKMIQHEHFHMNSVTAATSSAGSQDKGKSIFIPSHKGNGNPAVVVTIQHVVHFSKLLSTN